MLVVAVAVSAQPSGAASLRRPVVDTVTLNIGLVCRWDRTCIAKQKSAMRKALKYVTKYQPPQWRLHLCNKNAARGGESRVDWIGFNQCVRNPALHPPPYRAPAPIKKRRR